MDEALRARLAEIVGSGALDVQGNATTPASAADVAAVCRLCSETATPLSVRSGPPSGHMPPAGGLLVSLSRMTDVEVSAPRLVARAGAGAPLTALRSAVQDAGMTLAAPVGEGATRVGGLIALGVVARRALCGIEAVLPGGELVHSGGPVLKDVAGYDLAGVLLGSAGRLALIVAVTFRLLPAGATAGPEPSPSAGAALDSPLGELVRAAFDPARLLQPAVRG